MQKSNLPQGVKALMNMRDKGTLTFDNPVQRAGSQWDLLQKSLLIHSMLANFPVPTVYLLKSKNEDNVTIYDCLDAKQRLTSIFGFIDGEYALHSATPEVVVDGTPCDLANMKFEDLNEECQDVIKGYRFNITCIEEATEEEVEEIFRRLNNSTPLSPIQKCRSVMGSDLARWCKEQCNHPFFQYSVSLTLAQARREADLEVLLQSMLLLDARHEGYDYKAISTAEVTKYCKNIRGKYNEDKRRMIEEILDYLFSAFTEKHKFFKKSNIPMGVVLAKVALENNVKAEDFFDFIDAFSEGLSTAYMEGMGSGNIKRAKTEMRLLAIHKEFVDYQEINVDYETILSVHGNNLNVVEQVVDDSNETEELIEEPVSSNVVNEEVEENSADGSEDTTENTEDEVGAEDVSREDISVQTEG